MEAGERSGDSDCRAGSTGPRDFSPVLWIKGTLCPGVNRPGREADNLPRLRMSGAIRPFLIRLPGLHRDGFTRTFYMPVNSVRTVVCVGGACASLAPGC